MNVMFHLLLMMISGLADGIGVAAAPDLWQTTGKEFWLTLLRLIGIFSVGFFSYFGALRFAPGSRIESVATWAVFLVVGAMLYSYWIGELSHYSPIRMVVLILVGIGILYLIITG